MNNMHSFSSQKQNAIKQMNDMQKRATLPKNNPIDTTVNTQIAPKATTSQTIKHNFLLSNDNMIILGLILILSNEKCDNLLLLALIYILL